MASIKISELNPTGADLFADSESFMTELSDNDFSEVVGGYYFDTIDGDWCGTTRITLTRTTFPTRTISDISIATSLVVNQPVLM